MTTTFLAARNYDLALTLLSGQVFGWTRRAGAWEGVIGRRWVRLAQRPDGIAAQVANPVEHWGWLADYLQTEVDLEEVLESFPDDEPLRQAAVACRGLRLLRQDPWECLASFILSSTKQIVQIQQIVRALSAHGGEPVATPEDVEKAHAFPDAARVAALSEAELRRLKMGFRAPYLLAAARQVASGALKLDSLSRLSLEEARARLMSLPGVGRKIADCVLLFACGFQQAFPVDVWVMRSLRRSYFPGRKVSDRELLEFAESHFGPYGGYAQQYLFHHTRTGAASRQPPAPKETRHACLV